MNTLLVGCGEWGFRELPMQRHFEIARDFGFRYLEFGIGGDRSGRLATRLNAAEIGAFRGSVESGGIRGHVESGPLDIVGRN